MTLPSAPTSGSKVAALAWGALQNIQINSMSYDISVNGNSIQGSGDAGIDVVSDYKQIVKGTATATPNQKIFVITASSSFTAASAVIVNSRFITRDQVKVHPCGESCTR